MLLFAHAGLTLGVFALIPKAIFDRLHPPRKSLTNADYKETDPLFAWTAAARRWQLDYRIVLLNVPRPRR